MRRCQRGHFNLAPLFGWTLTLVGACLAGGGVWLLIVGIRMLLR